MDADSREMLDRMTSAMAGRIEVLIDAMDDRTEAEPLDGAIADAVLVHLRAMAGTLRRCAVRPEDLFPALPDLRDLPELPR